jgi:ribosomal protein L35
MAGCQARPGQEAAGWTTRRIPCRFPIQCGGGQHAGSHAGSQSNEGACNGTCAQRSSQICRAAGTPGVDLQSCRNTWCVPIGQARKGRRTGSGGAVKASACHRHSVSTGSGGAVKARACHRHCQHHLQLQRRRRVRGEPYMTMSCCA